MASTGAFTISNGGAPSPSSDRGFTAAAGDELECALEASPAFDVVAALYEVVLPTAGAPAVVLSTSSPSPPTATVTTDPLDAGVYSFVVRCTVTLVTGRLAVFERIVAIPNGRGHRKIIVGETLEFEAPNGWTTAFNQFVEDEDAGSTSGDYEITAGGDITITADPSTGTIVLQAGGSNLAMGPGGLAFVSAAPPSITGSREGNAALENLLIAGDALGLWSDGTTA